jgi:hypothetical protein
MSHLEETALILILQCSVPLNFIFSYSYVRVKTTVQKFRTVHNRGLSSKGIIVTWDQKCGTQGVVRMERKTGLKDG